MQEETKRKATRKIKKFDFSDESATVSLVGPAVGGPAVGYTTLLTKSNKKVSEEFIKKASQVTVTLEITEYLRRFFGLWYEDAEILARSLGYTTAEQDADSEEYESYSEYLDKKIASIQVMKQLHKADDINKALIDITEDDYLQLITDQSSIEKALDGIKKNSTKVTNVTEGDNSTNASVEKDEVSTSVVKQSKKGNKSMTKEVQTVEQTVEVIEKAQFDLIQKQLADQTVELQKALDLVKQFEIEKKESIAKSRKESLVKACGDKAEVIFKACGEASDGDFAAVVKALSEMQELVEKSALFQEQGASVSDAEQSEESKLAQLIKSKYAKQQ